MAILQWWLLVMAIATVDAATRNACQQLSKLKTENNLRVNISPGTEKIKLDIVLTARITRNISGNITYRGTSSDLFKTFKRGGQANFQIQIDNFVNDLKVKEIKINKEKRLFCDITELNQSQPTIKLQYKRTIDSDNITRVDSYTCGIANDPTVFPWIVTIQNKMPTYNFCYGALITQEHVIAEGKCIQQLDPLNDQIVFNNNYLARFPYADRMSEIKSHKISEDGNTAIIKIQKIDFLNEKINKICLASKCVNNTGLSLHSAYGSITGFTNKKFDENRFVLQDDERRQCNGVLVKNILNNNRNRWVLVATQDKNCLYNEVCKLFAWIKQNTV